MNNHVNGTDLRHRPTHSPLRQEIRPTDKQWIALNQHTQAHRIASLQRAQVVRIIDTAFNMVACAHRQQSSAPLSP
jgi:hypothetical protein